ncbi:MAG: hypothetical protein LQ338_007599 [Usnochroma carphineum]|nr:MAG: hypothetical protein LQ338_007599 [Usnochroma carphineum]
MSASRADMRPPKPLPFCSHFADVEEYIDSLLSFVTLSGTFRTLCGGVHILEFLTQDPDLYTALFPQDWRQFFDTLDVRDFLNLLMRSHLESLAASETLSSPEQGSPRWPSGVVPPQGLLAYIKLVRQHSLDRSVDAFGDVSSTEDVLATPVVVGMKPKKIHEVARLARYVDHLSSDLSSVRSCHISHLVDFGSGQNYLGRVLASPPYNKKVIAMESKPLNISGARSMDVTAKLAEKELVMRNKKQFRSQGRRDLQLTKTPEAMADPARTATPPSPTNMPAFAKSKDEAKDRESNMQYVEAIIRDGDLSSTLSRLSQHSNPSPQNLMVISLHSCGNLLHHGLRSLTLNPSVRAVTLVGCCYNLLTERLPPSPTHQPALRSAHPRLQQTSTACDPYGFPMSERFMTYPNQHGQGVRFNITARMMAVQAPQNWTEKDCQSFFTKHFYRALFQRMLVDKGAVEGTKHSEDVNGDGCSEQSAGSKPVILGSFRKQCYLSFTAYVRAAIAKLKNDPVHAEKIAICMEGVTDEEITGYEKHYGHKKKELSIVWSLMAFSAGVVESAIVVDRWQWLREQEEVEECWVESIFDYSISPRNLVVVGIKR